MTALDQPEELDIALLIFYAPCLFLTLFICFKQGGDNFFAWFLMHTFSISRVMGAAFDLSARQGTGDVKSLETGAVILNNLGFSALIGVLLTLSIRM